MTQNNRKIGLDLLKILAMFLITISHFIPYLSQKPFSQFDHNTIFLYDSLIKLTGQLGNILFLSISFFFLTRSNTPPPQKME